MEMKQLFIGIRSATLMLPDGGLYSTQKEYSLLLNGRPWGNCKTVVFSLYGLWPDTDYELKVLDGDSQVASASFRTAHESVTLNVRRFGAVGDGAHDDTPALQAAINCCPRDGRVLIPAGQYLTLPLFLKSHVSVELEKGAELLLCTDRSRFPILPGLTQTTDAITGRAPVDDELNLGSWEGNPLNMFAALITGIEVEGATLYGEGTLNGQAPLSDWWVNPKVMRGAFRPRMLFINRCTDFTMQGVTVKNSPAWNLHPYFSQHLRFLNLNIQAPANSPNTDGFDPESCTDIQLAGVHFSLGDDCIAIKSGKLYMGAKHQTPCKDIEISHCLMENGHGGVTVGSEMAGGVVNVVVHDCLMRNTDRGLRVKTRRGRGKDGVIDSIVFDHVRMEHVGTPFVVNAMYFCDPDGRSEYVQSREKQPVDDRTPRIGRVEFRNVDATDVCCAGYFLGLPEKPMEHVVMENVTIACAPDAKPMQPAMAGGVENCARRGIVAWNVDTIEMRNVTITGQEGEVLECHGVGCVKK